LSISLLSTDRRLVSSDQLRPPSPTNKAVNPIRRSSPGVQTHMNRNDRDVLCQNTIASSTSFFCRLQPHFSTVIKSSCQICSKVRLRVGPDSWTRSALWKTRPPQDCIERRLGHAHLTWIFVGGLHTGYGVGTALLARASQSLLDLGYTELLSSFRLGNSSSMLWHWRNGFELLPYAGSRRRFREMMRASEPHGASST